MNLKLKVNDEETIDEIIDLIEEKIDEITNKLEQINTKKNEMFLENLNKLTGGKNEARNHNTRKI